MLGVIELRHGYMAPFEGEAVIGIPDPMPEPMPMPMPAVDLPLPISSAPPVGSLFDAPKPNRCIDAPMTDGGDVALEEIENAEDEVLIQPIFEFAESPDEHARPMHKCMRKVKKEKSKKRKHRKGKKGGEGQPSYPGAPGGGDHGKPPKKIPKNPTGPPKHIPGMPGKKPMYPGMPDRPRSKMMQVLRAAPEPAYEVLYKGEEYEVRSYKNLTFARTSMPGGSVARAPREAFSKLYSYIAGANKDSESGDCFRIPMTAPVFSLVDAGKEGNVVMAFVLPAALARVPEPSDSAVAIKVVPEWITAVKSLKGSVGQDEFEAAEAELRKVVGEGWEVVPSAPAELARYDPPWIPGFFQRNEVFLTVRAK